MRSSCLAQDLLTGQAVCLSSPARAEMLNFEEGRTVRTTGGSQLHTVPRFQCRQFVAISVHPESPSYVVLLGTENHAVERVAYDCMCCGVSQDDLFYSGFRHSPLVFPQSGWIFTPTSATSIFSHCVLSLGANLYFPMCTSYAGSVLSQTSASLRL